MAYWYAAEPTSVAAPPPVEKRMPVLQDGAGNWLADERNQCPGRRIEPNAEMQKMKQQWAEGHAEE